MARFSRIKVASVMEETGLVPLFYSQDAELAKEVVRACYKGGARILEFTNRGDFAHEVFAELNKFAAEELPEMIVGAGSIPDGATASLYMQLGANFIVTPVLRKDVAMACNRRKVLWSPGCGSLTEIARAEELGAEIIKVFPGSQLGPGFVKAIKAPCPWTSIMPTGGVTVSEDNLKAWFDAGTTCVGMGSELITKEFLANKDFDGLEGHVRNTLAIIKKVRNRG
jgi:2-dehydro-3-deoxyphosphogluconate aldolase / (4S)-4-hydroxy-2-oxoglutarate aldolase